MSRNFLDDAVIIVMSPEQETLWLLLNTFCAFFAASLALAFSFAALKMHITNSAAQHQMW